jgi:hypothetical protein
LSSATASLQSLQKPVKLKSGKRVKAKKCGCGCGLSFVPKNSQQRYVDVQHRSRAYARRYRKRHNVHKEYQGRFFCPKCGELGQLFLQFRDNGVLMRAIVAHRRKAYSPTKRKALVKKGFSPKQILNKSVKVTKSIRDCYF